MQFKKLIFILISVICVDSVKILGVFPTPPGSHYILASKLMKGLVRAGHDVTMISPYKLKDPPKNGNYTDVILEGFDEEFQKLFGTFNMFDSKLQNPLRLMSFMTEMVVDLANKTLLAPNVQKLLQSDAQFDVVIAEQFFNDAVKVFAHVYNCPFIGLCSTGPNAWVNPTVGNPQPVSYVPSLLSSKFSPDSMLDRAKNALFYLLEHFMNEYYMMPKLDNVMHEVFPNAPPLYDLYTNASLVLLNSHISINDAVPMVPNMVEIGGYFIDPPKKLPEDLQQFLDGAKDGAIYFSMGSNLKSKDMSTERRTLLLNVLGKLKQKVLWKFEEDLPEKPSNVMIRKWLPQQDILAHPNIKMFITHGGLLSTTETIYHGVPILAIPVAADQPGNAARAAANGFGLALEFNDPNFSEEKLSSLINEILNNPKYKETAQKRSKLYHDRPETPMKTAVYWVEYVVRHKGAPHLRVAGVGMPWYKYFLADVIGLLIFSVLIVLYGLKLVFRKIFCKSKRVGTKKIKRN